MKKSELKEIIKASFLAEAEDSKKGNKEEQKTYFRHTGYAGGVKTSSLAHMRRTYPERIIEKAVKGMLPKGPLGRAMFRRLKVFSDSTHVHTAQNPQLFNL